MTTDHDIHNLVRDCANLRDAAREAAARGDEEEAVALLADANDLARRIERAGYIAPACTI